MALHEGGGNGAFRQEVYLQEGGGQDLAGKMWGGGEHNETGQNPVGSCGQNL